MDHDAFKSWLRAYGRAWETRNPEAATALFTDDAIYQETPFDQPFYGRSGILQYWSNVPRSKEQVKFSYEVLAVTETIGIARWWASFVRIPSRTIVNWMAYLLSLLMHRIFAKNFESGGTDRKTIPRTSIHGLKAFKKLKPGTRARKR